MFPQLFDVFMNKRAANKRVFEDFDKNVGRYVRPYYVYGTEAGKATQVLSDSRIIAEIINTHDDDLCVWKDLQIFPKWRIKIIVDNAGLTKKIMNPYIYGPSYETGRKGSSGPFPVVFDKMPAGTLV